MVRTSKAIPLNKTMAGCLSGVTLTSALTDFTTWLSEQLTDIVISGELIQVEPE